MTLFDIDFENVNESTIRSVEELLSCKDPGKLLWLNIDGLHNEQLMRELTDRLQIPADILSDVMEPGTRPQVEEFDNGLFLSIKMMQFNAYCYKKYSKCSCLSLFRKRRATCLIR